MTKPRFFAIQLERSFRRHVCKKFNVRQKKLQKQLFAGFLKNCHLMHLMERPPEGCLSIAFRKKTHRKQVQNDLFAWCHFLQKIHLFCENKFSVPQPRIILTLQQKSRLVRKTSKQSFVKKIFMMFRLSHFLWNVRDMETLFWQIAAIKSNFFFQPSWRMSPITDRDGVEILRHFRQFFRWTVIPRRFCHFRADDGWLSDGRSRSVKEFFYSLTLHLH